MKVNLPLTGRERLVDPAHPIVTKTDLKGIITYANRAFIDIGGFDESELIGHSHNVVRHPDMPPEAFADLWETIKAGLPWRGLVKNRSKNGDHYWVEAYVTPLTEHGRIIGYMSVRSAPQRSEVEQAEALYRAIREKRAQLPSILAHARKRPDVLVRGGIGMAAGLLLLALSGLWPDLAWGWRAALALPGLALCGLSGLWSWLRFRRVLTSMQDGFVALAEGRLDQPVQNGEGGLLGDLLRRQEALRIRLRSIIADVVSAGGHTHSSAESLQQEMNLLATRSSEQVEGLRQISGNMELIGQAVAEVALLAGQSLKDADSTREVAVSGNETMAAAASAAERTVSVVNESRQAIEQLNEAMVSIRAMTSQIHEIAEQTNLLALNASIEAARAGESGRGFAVVADEVRKLAERTSQTTDGITRTVERIAAITVQASGSMDATEDEVGKVSREIGQSASQLAELIETARNASAQARQIAEQMAQKSAAVQEVAVALEQLNGIAQGNLDTTQTVKNSSDHLALTASDLSKLTRDFRKWQSG
jgi:aerotaxis receptor